MPWRQPETPLRAVLADRRGRVALILIAAFTLMAAWPSLFTPFDPRDCDLIRSLDPPTLTHPFGWDVQGCDTLSRTIAGTRSSFTIGVAVGVLSLCIGGALGGIAGWFGGPADTLVTRAADAWMGLPLEMVGLLLLSFFEQRGVLLIIAVLTLFGWPPVTRLMRAAVLRERNAEYVQATRALGGTTSRIVLRHLVPNTVASAFAYASLFAGIAIAAEATLSFFGVGLQLPTESWGLQIAAVRNQLSGHPYLLAPGLFLSVAVLAFVLLAEAARDAFDPRTR